MGQTLEGIADPDGQTIAAFESDAEHQLAALRSGWHGKVASWGQGRIQDGGFCLCAATWTTCNEVVQSLRCGYWLRSVLGRARGIRSVRIAGVSGGVGSTVPIAPSPRTIG